MYKQRTVLLIISSLLVSCSNSKKVSAQRDLSSRKNDTIYVYKDSNQLTTLLNNTIGDCETCYVYETVLLLNKKITFIISLEVISNGKRFDKLFSVKTKTIADEHIIELKRKSTYINRILLKITDAKKYLRINSFITYQNESYKKNWEKMISSMFQQ